MRGSRIARWNSHPISYSERRASGKPVKVVHLTSVHPPYDVRIFEKECVGLARRGYDTVLIAPLDEDKKVDGVQIRSVASEARGWKRVLIAGRKTVRLARLEKGDIFHIHDPELLIWTPLLRLSGAVVVYDMHENVSASILDKEYIPARLRRVLAVAVGSIERWLARGLPVVFAEESYAEQLTWVRKSAVVLNVPLVEDLLLIRPPRSVRPSVAYLGAVHRDRGVDVTLQALKVLQDRGTTVAFECVGGFDDENDEARVRSLVTEFGLEHVTFHGRRRVHEACEIVARCHIGLAVLRDRPNYRNSLPTKLLDYLALGLAVIASDFPLYRRVVEETNGGLVVDPEDPAALADAIEQMLSVDLAATAGSGAAALASRYSWQQQLDNLCSFYDSLLGSVEKSHS